VFIVTKSLENLKLGLVEVLLFDEQSVTHFLQKTTPALEAELSARAERLRKAKEDLQAEQSELTEFQRTNATVQPEFLSLNTEVSRLKEELNTLGREWDNLSTMSLAATTRETEQMKSDLAKLREVEGRYYRDDMMRQAALTAVMADNLAHIKASIASKEENLLKIQIQDNEKRSKPKKAELRGAQAKLDAIKKPVQEMLDKLTENQRSCETAFRNCQEAIDTFPNVEFYFSDSRTPDIASLKMSALCFRMPSESRSAGAIANLER
jgi:chromosome segregation ATPase